MLVIQRQLAAQLHIVDVHHRIVSGRSDVHFRRSLVQRRHHKIGIGKSRRAAHDDAGNDLEHMPPQQVEQFHQVDLVFLLIAHHQLRLFEFVSTFHCSSVLFCFFVIEQLQDHPLQTVLV